MSIHIEAKKEEVADIVLLPGDPLRAKYIAENFLEGAQCYNKVRGMFGFTGTYKGRRISIQGTGMGQASASIYINELISFYGAKTLMRIGSCGSIQERVRIRDIVVAIAASHDSNMNASRFPTYTYAPTVNSELLFKAKAWSDAENANVHYGNVFSTDAFYHDDENYWKQWAAHEILAIEMETAQLYTLAAKYGVRALGMFTVSDHLISKEETSSEEREKTFVEMMRMALDIASE